MADGAGWDIPGSGGANTPLNIVQTKPKNVNGQHIVYGLTVSFSGTPAAPVLCQLVNPDISPNPIHWEGYLAAGGIQTVNFPAGIAWEIASQVMLEIGAGGSGVKAAGSIHGITR